MKNILSIEDNSQTINEIKDHLRDDVSILRINDNFDKVTLQQIQSYKPDLILLDIKLFGENDKTGIEIAKMLQNQGIPIIMLSCKIEYKKYLMENNLCQWFLPKPIHISILLEKINQFLR